MRKRKSGPPKSKKVKESHTEELALISADPYLKHYASVIHRRYNRIQSMEQRLTGGCMSLADFASGHEYFGLHREGDEWVFREWAPNATSIFLIGDCNSWRKEPEYALRQINENGTWELRLPFAGLKHTQLYKLLIYWPGGHGERIPVYTRRAVQDPHTKLFAAQVWAPDSVYQWREQSYHRRQGAPRIYEAHVGMSQSEEKIGTFSEFRQKILPRVVDAGYNTLQLMAIQEHPYYGSFGYHVSSFFAASSRFGTPEELKELIDAAHVAGLSVIMDIVQSHAARNEQEGISRFDGSFYQYFHDGPRGFHWAWDSRCFDYAKPEVIHFLLSNCRFWLDEYHFDGFRFDGVTSMLYFDHGLGKIFTSYDDYYGDNVDEDAVAYLALANKVIHTVRPDAITIAEDVSGMPGLAVPRDKGGYGFDYRLAMGMPDYWIKLMKEVPDERWPMSHMYYELTNRRADEKTIGYAESHDQALVGDKALIFWLIDADMYYHMGINEPNLRVDRGIALHKLIRLITLASAGNGYLNFMGNEFGHPEWIDFPREGNNWSYKYARRQWNLRDDKNLRYRFLAEFDKAMMLLAEEYGFLDTPGPWLRLEHQDNQLIGFERANLIFLFSFNPTRSFSDYPVDLPSGEYQLILDSDAAEFGGHGRVQPGQVYFTWPESLPDGGMRHFITIYLPTRTALVLRKNL
ncbi:MAG TPA: alpha amylase C-terminal domain-containing protein [Syntrophales bacterium]|nr:alpha amylase C-terminal domain-containing protein [Syntrophales bacterium]